MGKLLSFNSKARGVKYAPSQTADPNQHIRASWIRQFTLGKSAMALARQNKVQVRLIENEIREQLWRRAA